MELFRKFFFSLVLLSVFGLATASQDFVVKNIQIEGLQNLVPSTVYSYLTIKQGETFSYNKSTQILKSLYKTGFFDKVDLSRRGDVLIVKVVERPMITLVKLDGNKDIPTDKIQPVLKQMGVAAGNVYDPAKLKFFEQSLEHQYGVMGYASVKVSSTVKDYPNNRVEIDIKVSEIKVVTINLINFEGNKHFSGHRLRKQMSMKESSFFSWFNNSDRYSELKLHKSLDELSNFYLNHGYAEFKVLSHSLDYAHDHKQVDVHIKLHEGPLYKVYKTAVTGKTLNFQKALLDEITFKSGDVFSRAAVVKSQQAMKRLLADHAYAFATVRVVPDVDRKTHRVSVTFDIDVGKQVYVRRIGFTGNAKTDQAVLRREMRQMEAAPYSLTNVEQSKRHLMLLPYFPQVTVSKTPVLDTNNQMDLTYHVIEKAAGKASVQGGYSSGNGFVYGASISQPNFLGTGKYASLGFNNGENSQRYYFSYTNPYYTWNHISRGFVLYYNLNHYSETYNYTPYTMDSYGADLKYGFPLSENNSLHLDFGYSNAHVFNVEQANVAPSVSDFMDPDGNNTDQFLDNSYDVTRVVSSWTYNGLDRYFMPTRGVRNQLGITVGVPLFSNNLTYYTLTEDFSAYVPIGYGFLLNFIGNFGYGMSYDSPDNDLFPFMYNFRAGGIGKVAGYQQGSLGPKYADGTTYAGSALGGNLMTIGGVHLVLPDMVNNNLRIALTFEAGNVFQSPIYQKDVDATTSNGDPLVIQDDSFALKNMRMSAGVMVVWNVPMLGPIDLSLAFPLNEKDGDEPEPFQFAMGISF